ncbi:hypothetical protein [Tengunoibacter tsumagoiensis]|uniref:HEAT repeat domain-containing protein n=1 Tax=Tengunoibacter tsumagoiensis TaxID=2014871 RepID=A0A401ZZI8_9CHLR|nr:hypothetical protein [Tengunoibacter tsumagoiensis]GCE12280.1 hypothetical protein KTT_21390 [Tengunoibacter tsumagoiensis]
MFSLEQRLRQVPWATLRHAYGSAEDTPQHLLDLLSDEDEIRNGALDRLWASICHQGSVYEASCAAVPFLIEILQQVSGTVKASILALLAGVAHTEWYAKRSQRGLTMNQDGASSYHEWWSFESFLQKDGNIYHQPEWLVKAHKLVGEGMPVYLTLLHTLDKEIVSSILDLLAGYREFQTELVPELIALYTRVNDYPLQCSILECLSALLDVDAPEWSLYHRYIVDQDAPPRLRFTAAESLAWYQPQSISSVTVALLTDILLTCSLQPGQQGFEGTYWSDLTLGTFIHALRALCRLEPSLATQALSRVLSTAASGWIILDAIRVAEALLDVAFFGGWIENRDWMYQTNLLDDSEWSSSDLDEAFFRYDFGQFSYPSSGSGSLSEPLINVIGYDEQEANRLSQLYKHINHQILSDPQRLALETIIHCDALWQTSHNLLAIYGLPIEKEQAQALLDKVSFLTP